MENKPNENNPTPLTRDLVDELKEYLELRVDKAKLSAAEHLTTTISSFYGVMLATFFAIIALLFCSLALIFALGDVVGYGFSALIVAGGYVVLAVVCFLLRVRLLETPLLKMFINMFWKNRE